MRDCLRSAMRSASAVSGDYAKTTKCVHDAPPAECMPCVVRVLVSEGERRNADKVKRKGTRNRIRDTRTKRRQGQRGGETNMRESR